MTSSDYHNSQHLNNVHNYTACRYAHDIHTNTIHIIRNIYVLYYCDNNYTRQLTDRQADRIRSFDNIRETRKDIDNYPLASEPPLNMVHNTFVG